MLRTTTRTVIVTSEFHLINLFLSCLFVCVCMCFKLMYLGMINFSFYLFDDDEYFFSILKKRTHVFLDFFLSTLTHDTDTYMCVAEVRVVVASIAASIYI